jgi:hypothetical protein
MKTRKFILILVPILVLLLVFIFVETASGIGSALGKIYLPLVAYNYDPSLPPPTPRPLGANSIDLSLSASTVNAGESISVTVTVKDQYDGPFFESFFDVFMEVQGRSAHEELIPLTSHGDGTYTGVITKTTSSGPASVSTFVFDTESMTKWDQYDWESFQVLPLQISYLEMKAINFREFQILGRDIYSNSVPITTQAEADEVTCVSDNTFMPFDVDVSPDPNFPGWMWRATINSEKYGRAFVSCTHNATGVSSNIEAGYPPIDIFVADSADLPSSGFPAESFFDVYFKIPKTPDPEGWGTLIGSVIVDQKTGVIFNQCAVLDNDFVVECTPRDSGVPDMLQIVFTATYTSGGVIADTIPFTMSFQAPDVDPLATEPLTSKFFIDYIDLFTPGGISIFTNWGDFMFLMNWDWLFKPTKTLNMHVWIVEGEATQAQVQADVDTFENGFNSNAFSCSCGFFIDVHVTFHTITKSDWKKIDQDNDGLDRYDRNKDGDYADDGDNNDLFNAMNLDYYEPDMDGKTENVYYVPSIRNTSSSGGTVIGMTFSPNGQVAVNNSADSDNLTLFHEKVHEMDYRDDGDFDVDDSPDDDKNAQGAQNPGNIMNYGNMGTNLTPTQCGFLDP